jgi:hypothetical protein
MSQCDQPAKTKEEAKVCTKCKTLEKKYLKSEAKYLKAMDRL